MERVSSSISRVEELKGRVKRCCCKYCGGKLEIRRIIFSEFEGARVEIFCENCNRIEFGVEPEIYQSAEYFVDEFNFNCYSDLDSNERTRRMNIAKVCEIMAWGYKHLGIVSTEGFSVPINTQDTILGECVVIEDDYFEQELVGGN